jgi:tetratricopeptide (TPR) repeat protein
MEPQELLRAAQLLFVEEKDRESIEAYTKAIEAGADPYIAHLSRGAAYVKTKEVDKAIDDFDNAIKANSQSYRAFFYRGMAYMMETEFEKAIDDFTNALKLKSDYGMALFARAVSFARLDKYDEATRDMAVVVPQMEQGLQSFADTYGIVRTEMWKVMAQVSGEAETPSLELNEKEMETLHKWLRQEE